MRVVLFCHVEPGTCRDRTVVFDATRDEGIRVALPRIAEFADQAGIPVTFAMTPVALRENPIDMAGHEVALHLHPQDAFLRERVAGVMSVPSDCLGTYTTAEQRVLISASKAIFEEVVGSSPKTFVAGRWSENPATLRLLLEAGFLFDGSPLPGHASPCSNWARVPRLAQPYAPSEDDYQAHGLLNYVYIPVYQGYWGHYLTPELIHLLGPSYFRAALHEARIGGAHVVHMYFHSPMAVDPSFLCEFQSVLAYARDELQAQFSVASDIEATQSPLPRPFPPAYFAGFNWRLAKTFLGRREFGQRLLE